MVAEKQPTKKDRGGSAQFQIVIVFLVAIAGPAIAAVGFGPAFLAAAMIPAVPGPTFVQKKAMLAMNELEKAVASSRTLTGEATLSAEIKPNHTCRVAENPYLTVGIIEKSTGRHRVSYFAVGNGLTWRYYIQDDHLANDIGTFCYYRRHPLSGTQESIQAGRPLECGDYDEDFWSDHEANCERGGDYGPPHQLPPHYNPTK